MSHRDAAPPSETTRGRLRSGLLLGPLALLARLGALLGRLPGLSILLALLRRRQRLPIILQSSFLECGAACLAMVLSYHGRKTRLAECREQCQSGRDGVTARVIAQAARDYGLQVKAFSLEPAHFGQLRLPAIAHWNFSHFVVVERWSSTRAVIVDPAVGRMTLSAAEFDAAFTGVVLTFEPGPSFSRQTKPTTPLWRRFLATVLDHPGLLLQILGASLLLQLLGLILPVFTKLVVDQHHDITLLRVSDVMGVLGIGILVLIGAQVVINYLRSLLVLSLQARLDSTMMLGFFEHMLSLPYRFFQERASGDLLLRMGSNVPIREVLTNQMIASLLDSGFVLVYLVILFTQDATFGLLALGLGLLQVVLLSTTGRVRDLLQRDLTAQSESQSYLVEALSGIVTLKASGAEPRAFEHWSNLYFRQLNISLQRGHLAAVIETAMGVLRTFSPIVLLWIGTQRVLDHSMTLGTMLALNVIATSFLTPLTSLISSVQRLQLVGAHLDRLGDILEAAPEQEAELPDAPPLSGRVELRNVSFRYDARAPLAVEGVSLTIERGQKVALVGRTGSGKSTLVKLLLGLYLPTEGEICYDGLPLQSVSHRSVRGQFGSVLQESFLFSGSIRQNIAFNDPAMPFEQVLKAAQLAGIHDDIARMPMGYDTRISEGGSALSGGQRQRLALARALAHAPAGLILDEATSHLDVLTEALVDRHISELACTRIVIAHRLSTIRNADLIVVLDQGRIVERGTHEELLALHGHYAGLVRSQGGDDSSLALRAEAERPMVGLTA